MTTHELYRLDESPFHEFDDPVLCMSICVFYVITVCYVLRVMCVMCVACVACRAFSVFFERFLSFWVFWVFWGVFGSFLYTRGVNSNSIHFYQHLLFFSLLKWLAF